MNLTDEFENAIAEHERVIVQMRAALQKPFEVCVLACVDALKGGGKILFCGNGGSAADAQHLATELVVRFAKDRPSLSAIALTTDSSALTAIGNDFGFDDLFARQIEGLGRPGDVVIGISTSGRSPNVIRALEKARILGLTTVGFGGGMGGRLMEVADITLVVPSVVTARIQECHILLGHMLCSAIEVALGYR